VLALKQFLRYTTYIRISATSGFVSAGNHDGTLDGFQYFEWYVLYTTVIFGQYCLLLVYIHITLSLKCSSKLTILFCKVLSNKDNRLQQYLPQQRQLSLSLKTRTHNLSLIPKTTPLNERHFLIRALYKTIC